MTRLDGSRRCGAPGLGYFRDIFVYCTNTETLDVQVRGQSKDYTFTPSLVKEPGLTGEV